MKGFPGSSAVKNPPATAGDRDSIPGSGRSPGEGKVTHFSILAWEIPWTKKPGGLKSTGLQKSQQQQHFLIYWYLHNIYEDILGICILIMFPHLQNCYFANEGT